MDDEFPALIQASSLGSPQAKALRRMSELALWRLPEMFTLQLTTETAAMRTEDDSQADPWTVAEKLREVADLLENGYRDRLIKDANGNPIGKWQLTND